MPIYAHIYKHLHIQIYHCYEKGCSLTLLTSKCRAFGGCLLFIMLYIIYVAFTLWFPFPWHLCSSGYNCLNNWILIFVFPNLDNSDICRPPFLTWPLCTMMWTGKRSEGKLAENTQFTSVHSSFLQNLGPLSPGCPGCFWCLQTIAFNFLIPVLELFSIVRLSYYKLLYQSQKQKSNCIIFKYILIISKIENCFVNKIIIFQC